jgi:carboxyl-terminal processing protease
MASWFLPSGQVVVTEDYGAKQDPIVHRSAGYDVIGDDVKTVILVDKGSASASEILSGALHAYGKATMIGTNTFGKGSVQELVAITPDTSLKVTVARWLLPGNIWIPHTGIVPDIMATTTAEAIAAHKDEQMDRAVQFLNTGK